MTSVRLPDEIEQKLAKLCHATKRSKSFYIKEALENYLDDIADFYEVMDRISRPNRKLITNEELSEILNKNNS